MFQYFGNIISKVKCLANMIDDIIFFLFILDQVLCNTDSKHVVCNGLLGNGLALGGSTVLQALYDADLV